MNQKLFAFVLLGALSTSLMLHAVPGDNQPPEATLSVQAQGLADTTPPTASPVANASAAPEEALHPSRLEQVRDNLNEELGGDFQSLTEEQQGLMVDIMQKVHDIVPALNIQLIKASARWKPDEAADHEARCLEEARQALEQHLTPALGSEEAAAESRHIQESRATENEKLSEAVSNFITDMPKVMKNLFRSWIGCNNCLTVVQEGSFTHPFKTTCATIVLDEHVDNGPTEEIADPMRALLDMLETSHLKWQTDDILRVNLFEKLFAKSLRQEAAQQAMKAQLELLSQQLVAKSHAVPETALQMLQDEACQEVLAEALPHLFGGVAKQWLLTDYGVPLGSLAEGYVPFEKAPAYERIFRDIYEHLIQLIRTTTTDTPADETIDPSEAFRYLFAYKL
ncbi:MAG: hypothetical protein V6Z78_00220 [Holosporaceae bacterium]